MLANVANVARGVSAARPARGLAGLPGSSRPDELIHLLRDPTGFLHARFERHGRLWKTRFVVPAVFAIGDEANRALLVTRRDQFPQGQGYARTPVRWVFEGSIMLQDGDQHARTRATLTPAVGRLAIHESAARVQAIWARHVDALEPARGERDVYEIAERATFEVAATVLAGLPLGDAVDAFRPLFEDVIGGMMVSIPVRVPFGRLDRSLRARAALVRLLGPHVEAARAREPTGLIGHLAHHRDDAGRPLSVQEIVEHVVLLAWAGYDTTASQASWILHTLAQRPDWQARLRDELAAIDDPTALESGARAPALECFLLEIERMYPSALFFPRVAVDDVELLGHRVPRGTLIFYSPYLTHRDPAIFEHPNAFDPERWSSARGERRVSPARLFGFGGGPRVCLGKAFAKLQLRVMVQVLLRRRHVEPDPRARPHIQGLPVHHPVGARIRVRPVRSEEHPA